MKAFRTLAKWIVYLLIGVIGILAGGVLLLTVYKDKILAKINTKLEETVNGEVKLGDYDVSMFHDFPHLSITLHDIYLHGPRFENFHKPFLKADRVHINIASHKLFAKEIDVTSVDIENGEIFIFKTQAGYSNTDVFKSRRNKGNKTSSELAVVDFREINLRNVKLAYHDSLKLKHVGVDFHHTRNVIKYASNGTTRIETQGYITFHGLMLNAEKGSFLRDVNARAELNVELDSTLQHLAIQPSKLAFEKATVDVSGNFNLDDKKFNLLISSNNVDHQEAQRIVHDTLASKISRFNVAGPIKIEVAVNGTMQAGVKPAVDVKFSLRESDASMGKFTANHVTLTGTFMNHVNKDVPNDDNNARLHFDKVNATVDNIPVQATVTLTDMKDPRLDLKAVFDTPLKNLNENFDSTTIRFKEGHFHSAFVYSGKLSEYMDDTRTEYNGKLTGQATITNGAFHYNRRSYRVNDLNAVFDFTEKEFAIRSFHLSVNKNDIAITGAITDFVPFFIQPKGSANVKLNIVSPRIDLTGVTKPHIALSKSREKARAQKSKEKMVDIVDRLNEQLDLNVTFNIARFINRNFVATNLKGQLLLANNALLLKGLSMHFGGGTVKLESRVSDVDNKISPLSIQAKADGVALKDFFHAFNDFNQKTFTHDNIEGQLTLGIDLRAALDEKLDLQMNNMNGNATFTIQGMHLKNFEPIQRLSNFLMKKRDFTDVSFSDINSSVDMQGTKMQVQRMEVGSTVISMFIEGIYDLGDSTDLAVQVPLSNLKKRDQEIPPEHVGTDSRVGPSVYLRVRTDKEGKTVISYDPFKKFRKNGKNKKNTTV